MPKPFIAIDGESYTIDGEHRYVLLMDSNRRYLYDPAGLSTKKCLDFLLDLGKSAIPVAFGLNYDVNMVLRDMGRKKLTQLWTEGKAPWYEYDLTWIPGKWFAIATGVGKNRRTIRINETFGFFQSSFVKALEKWNIPYQDADELEAMKATRSAFDQDMTKRVIAYCHSECVLLVQLMDALRDALQGTDIFLDRWIGAGSIASALLSGGKKCPMFTPNHVKVHHVPHTELPPEVGYASLGAYFGGRTELFQQGEFPTVTEYDIASAYPFAALSLSSLRGTWTNTIPPVETLAKTTGLFEVQWNLPLRVSLAPFPYRYKGSRICYPLNGRGWYHGVEVAAALAHYPDYIDILDGWAFTPEDEARPFSWIPELYAYRRKLKAEGHAGEKCIKLGINSVYGKLAQGVGYRGRPPEFQSYVWAGQITAATRARMFTLAMEHPHDVLMLATDAIFYRGNVDHPTGTNLGDLERVNLTDVFLAQPGVYHAFNDGDEVKRSRGFFAKEIDFDQLRQGYRDQGPHFIGRYESTRFVGAGTALMAKTLDDWRSWVTKDRKLTLYPSQKRLRDPDERPLVHLPPEIPSPVIPSQPYSPKMGGYLDDEVEYAQGREQPLRT